MSDAHEFNFVEILRSELRRADFHEHSDSSLAHRHLSKDPELKALYFLPNLGALAPNQQCRKRNRDTD
jgi:hypothetical protein